MLPIDFSQLAFHNLDRLSGRPRGLVLAFHGMGAPPMRETLDPPHIDLAERGIAWVFPYYGPWCWLNRSACRFVDAVVEHVRTEFGLPAGAPLVTTGCSMGGFAALAYARDGAHRVDAVVANCPATDLPALARYRPDIPRALAYAHRGETMPFDQWIVDHSPLHGIDRMPDIPYLIVHGDADEAVPKPTQGDPMAAALRDAGRSIDYIEVPGMPHCGPLPEPVHEKMHRFVVEAVERSGQREQPA